MSTTSSAISKTQSWRALAALCVGLFITLMDQSLVAVALPAIREHFDASLNQSVWVVSIYLLTFAVPLLVTGRLGDRFGQRNVYLVGMTIFVLAALACVFAPSIEWVIVFRGIQGLGGSLINPQPMAIINRIFPYHRRGAATGIWSSVGGSAGLIGPVVGGLVVGLLDWRWVFALYVPIGIVSLVMVALFVPHLPRGTSVIDAFSALLSLVAVIGVIFAVQQGPETGWTPLIWASLIVGVVVLGIFLRRQHSLGERALMPLALFRTRNFALGATAVFTLGVAVYPIQLPIMMYLQLEAGLAPERAALALIPMGALSIFIAPLAGRLTDRLKPGVLSTIGFSLMITAMVLFASLMFLKASVWWILIPVALLGVANGMVWSANSTISMRSLPGHLTGAGSGVYNTSRQIGAVAGAAVVGAVMAMAAPLGVGAASAWAMVAPAVLLVGGLIAVRGFRVDETH